MEEFSHSLETEAALQRWPRQLNFSKSHPTVTVTKAKRGQGAAEVWHCLEGQQAQKKAQEGVVVECGAHLHHGTQYF